MKRCPYSWKRGPQAGDYELTIPGANLFITGECRAEGYVLPWAWSVQFTAGGQSGGMARTLAYAKAMALEAYDRRMAA